MRKYVSHLLLLCIVAGMAACTDRMSPTQPRHLLPQQPGKDISDGAHVASDGKLGNSDVFFLPPMVSNPSKATGYGDPFQPGLPVSFRVTDQNTSAVIKTFVPTVDLTNQFYSANWDTKSSPIDLTHTYRINVVIGSRTIAYADVIFGANGASLKNLDSDDFVGLVDGRTLPMKVRVERGWDCVDKTSCVTQVVPNTIPTGQTVVVSTGGTLPNSAEFSPSSNGTWATHVDGTPITGPIVVTIQDVTSQFPAAGGGCGKGLSLQLTQNHCIRITTDPAVKLTSRVRLGTCLANPGDDRQLLVKYDTDPNHQEAPRFLEDAPPPAACPPPQIGSTIHSTNPLVRFAATVTSGVGRGINWVLGVKPAYAFDTGVGGFVGIGDGFSLIAPAFPKRMLANAGDGQQAQIGSQVANALVVHLQFVHDVGEDAERADINGASLTCQALTSGAGFATAPTGGTSDGPSLTSSIAAASLGNGLYSCGRPFLSPTAGANQFKVTSAGVPDAILFNVGDDAIQLPGSVTFTEQGITSSITSVSIDRPSLNLQQGDQPVLHATVGLVQGSEASTAVTWTIISSTPTGAIDIKPAGNAVEVIANGLGTATLRATSAVDPSKHADATINITQSFFGAVQDASGDAVAPPEEVPNPDLIFASLTAARGSLNIVIRFAPAARATNTIGRISFDTDRDITTGLSGIDAAHTDADKIGVDYVMLVGSGFNSGKAQLIRIEGTSSVGVGSFDAEYVGDEIHVTIPLSALGSNGSLNFKAESEVLLSTGAITPFLDIAPNAGLPVGTTLPSVPSPIG